MQLYLLKLELKSMCSEARAKKIDVQPSLNTAKSHVLAFSFLAFVVKTKPPSPIMMDGQITKKGFLQSSQLSTIWNSQNSKKQTIMQKIEWAHVLLGIQLRHSILITVSSSENGIAQSNSDSKNLGIEFHNLWKGTIVKMELAESLIPISKFSRIGFFLWN